MVPARTGQMCVWVMLAVLGLLMLYYRPADVILALVRFPDTQLRVTKNHGRLEPAGFGVCTVSTTGRGTP